MLPTMPPISSPALSESPGIAVASNAQMMEAERNAEDQAAIDRAPVVSAIAAHIKKRWEDAKRAKSDIEKKMLAALRQRVGEYDPQKLAEIQKMGGSTVFVRLTDLKCSAAAAWIRDVLSLDRPWGLEPTPIPDLPAGIEQQARQQAFQQIQMQIGATMMPPDPAALQSMLDAAAEQAKAEAEKAMDKEARHRAEKMAEAIEDYLDEGDFKDALGEALDWDFVTFGTAILRSPVVRVRRRLQWEQDPATLAWTPAEVEESYPAVERVSPLDFYPADDATGIDDASYLVERYPLSRSELAAFKTVDNWNSIEIDAALEEYGRDGTREWTSADSERATLAERSDAGQYSEKLDALIFWGEVQGSMLAEWGIKSVEPLAEYAVEAWLIGNHVVRVEIKEPHMLARPYQKAVYRPRPGAFWGVGVPELMEDIQQQANAAARALANNMGLASGPMVGIDLEQLPPGEDGSRIWPWKVWRFNTAKYGTTNTPPISFFQPQMHAMELMQIYEKWVRIADEVTGIPAYVQGNENVGGAGKTASGLSMLMGAATKQIKAVIANIDSGLIEPLIAGFFRHAMLYHPDDSIKGDCRVITKGSTALLVRDQAQMRRKEFLQATNNPVDLQIMGLGRRAELMRRVAETLSIDADDVAPTREEMERQQQAQQQQQMQMQMQNPQPGAAIGPDGQPVAGQDVRSFNPEG